MRTVSAKDVRDINLEDFRQSISRVLPSVSKKTVERWAFGRMGPI